ncbi:MAG: CoA-binding protein [Alphaproteobacteria bacterium]|nr:CoA-binding protein [Alphaproteobacteria bacterium]
MPDPTALSDVADLFASVRTIAVLGAHVQGFRPACYVPDYLHAQGYRILPVNPTLVGETAWGEPFRATLADVPGPIDLVDVFRRPDQLPGHEAELLALDPPPQAVWFQLGIRHDAVAERLRAAGLRVIQDRCTLADHRALAARR